MCWCRATTMTFWKPNCLACCLPFYLLVAFIYIPTAVGGDSTCTVSTENLHSTVRHHFTERRHHFTEKTSHHDYYIGCYYLGGVTYCTLLTKFLIFKITCGPPAGIDVTVVVPVRTCYVLVPLQNRLDFKRRGIYHILWIILNLDTGT
jgi:hypothetical protein